MIEPVVKIEAVTSFGTLIGVTEADGPIATVNELKAAIKLAGTQMICDLEIVIRNDGAEPV